MTGAPIPGKGASGLTRLIQAASVAVAVVAASVALLHLVGEQWLMQNPIVVVAFLALAGTALTAYLNRAAHREATVADEMEDRREFYEGLWDKIKELRALNEKLDDEHDELREQNSLLRSQIQKLTEVKQQLEQENQTLREEATVREREMKALQKDVLRLNRRVSELEAQGGKS